MSEDQTPRKTRRPLSLSDKLLELRDAKRNALAKLIERQSRLAAQLHAVTAQRRDAEAELARVQLAIGDARDTERSDVETTDLQHKQPVGRPHSAEEQRDIAEEHGIAYGLDGTVAVARATDPDLRGVAVVDGTNGAPAAAAVVRVNGDGSAIVESTHDTVEHAARALNGQA